MRGAIMSVLTQFLKDEGQRLRAVRPEREAKLAEWQAAVGRLMAQLAGWVREADPEGLIEITEGESQRLVEGMLGEYDVPRLGLRLDTRHVWVVPKARNDVTVLPSPDGGPPRRTDGLVVITEFAPVDGFWRIGPLTLSGGPPAWYLHRVHEAGVDAWYLRHPTEAGAEPLTRDRFESILVAILK
jgi:hypothetical protein